MMARPLTIGDRRRGHGRARHCRGAAQGRHRGHRLRAGQAIRAARGRHPGRLQRHEGAARAWPRGSGLRGGSFYPRSWNNRDWRTGEVKFDMIFGESAEQKFGAPYLLAHRGDLHAALASAVPDECIKLGHKLVGMDETGRRRPVGFCQWRDRGRRCRDRRRRRSFGGAGHAVRRLAGAIYRPHRLPHDLSCRAPERPENR